MPRGDKDAYTDKQKRKAEHIAEGSAMRTIRKTLPLGSLIRHPLAPHVRAGWLQMSL